MGRERRGTQSQRPPSRSFNRTFLFLCRRWRTCDVNRRSKKQPWHTFYASLPPHFFDPDPRSLTRPSRVDFTKNKFSFLLGRYVTLWRHNFPLANNAEPLQTSYYHLKSTTMSALLHCSNYLNFKFNVSNEVLRSDYLLEITEFWTSLERKSINRLCTSANSLTDFIDFFFNGSVSFRALKKFII